jgi:hypothetical protein
MRHSSHSPFATALLLIPIITVPLLAIFGVPQITPVVPPAVHSPSAKTEVLTDATEFTPASAERWEALEEFPTSVTSVPASEWVEVPPDPTAQAVADRRAEGLPRPPPLTQAIDTPPPATAPPTSPSAGEGGALPRAAPPPAVVPIGYVRDTADGGRNGKSSASRRAAPAPPTPTLTWQSAVRKLNDLEIRNFRLEPGQRPDQFVFICSYTPPDNPRVSYRFEAEADEPLRAVEKVLMQIDSWLASR